jgi:hypothetical protein
LAAIAGVDVAGMSDEVLRHEVLELVTAADQLRAALSSRLAGFDARGLAQPDGQRTTRAWLSAWAGMAPSSATAVLAQARILTQLPALLAAAGRGEVGADYLRLVCRLVDSLSVEQVQRHDAELAEAAARFDLDEFAEVCERIHYYCDPDGAEPDPDKILRRRGVTLSAHQDGMTGLRGQLDPQGAAALRTALDALTPPPSLDDERTAAQRRADALTELAMQAITTGRLPLVGGVRPALGILINPTTLIGNTDDNGGGGDDGGGGGDPLTRAGIPPIPDRAWLDGVGAIPTALAQRLACDADVWRIILDPFGSAFTGAPPAHPSLDPQKHLHARDRWMPLARLYNSSTVTDGTI